jgi:hypothetical protein
MRGDTIHAVGDLVYKRPRKLWKLDVFYPAIASMSWRWLPTDAALIIDAVAAVPALLLLRTWSTTVAAQGITIRTLTRRFIPWAQVRDIRVDFLAGDSSIDVYLLDGTRKRLPAPLERLDRHHDAEFVDEYAEILAMWKAHGRPPRLPEADGPQRDLSSPESPTR